MFSVQYEHLHTIIHTPFLLVSVFVIHGQISTEPNRNLYWCLSLCSMNTSTPFNMYNSFFIGLFICLGVGQYERTTSQRVNSTESNQPLRQVMKIYLVCTEHPGIRFLPLYKVRLQRIFFLVKKSMY